MFYFTNKLPKIDKSKIKCISEFNQGFIFSRVKIGLIILLIGLIYSAKNILNGSFAGFVSLGIVMTIFIFYWNYTLAQFKSWVFTEKGLFLRKLNSPRFRFHPYTDISIYQVRQRFGEVSKNEIIPNYEEVNVWMKNKSSMAFDAIDFINYQELKLFFETKMKELGIHPAEYRE